MNASKNQSLVQVPFDSDVLEAVQTDDGKIMVSIKRVCESLGIDYAAQFTRLRNRSWATIAKIATVAEDGKLRELTMIDHESLPIWMTHINPLKVAPSVREKIDRFQREAKAVLSAWFLGTDPPRTTRERPAAEHVPNDHLRMLEIHRRLEVIRGIEKQWLVACKELGDTASTMLCAAEDDPTVIDVTVSQDVASPSESGPLIEIVAEPTPAPDDTIKLEVEDDAHEYMPVWQFFEMSNVRVDGRKPNRTARSVFSAEIRRMSMDFGVPIKREPSAQFGTVNSYRIDVLWAWKDKHVRRERESSERAKPKAERPASKPQPTHTQPRFDFLERNGVAC